MNRLVVLALLSCLTCGSMHAKGTKKSVRTDLAEQQRASSYSLIDPWASSGEVYVVSVEDRSSSKAKPTGMHKLSGVECSSPNGRYTVFHRGGIWLRRNETGESTQIDPQGEYSSQCFSNEDSFVYSTGSTMKIYDIREKKNRELGSGNSATWSPDGKLLCFDDGKHYFLLNAKTGSRKRLFGSSSTTVPTWSPDSRYLTYTKSGGSTGGFLFWGIKCIEPYRVWVWRVEDGAHDWVQQICKPGRSFIWVQNSQLRPE